VVSPPVCRRHTLSWSYTVVFTVPQRQIACWAAKRQARLAELGFTDVEGYLRVRRVEQGWSLRRILAELQVSSAWLKDQMQRLDMP
jgi:hypothetical protein